jgi:hypothetical protein
MKIKYLLKKRGKKSPTHPVYIALYDSETTELIYTQERIALNQWSKAQTAPLNPSAAMVKMMGDLKKIEAKLKLDDVHPTPYLVKQQYLLHVKAKASQQREQDQQDKTGKVTVIKLANQYLTDSLYNYDVSTQKAVKESINQFIAWLKIAGFASLERKELTTPIINQYERYLLEKKKLADSTHGKRIKHLRWFLKSLDFDVTKIKIRTGKAKKINLTMKEWEALEAVDVSSSSELQKAKDLYLIGTYTAQRISDIRRINPNQIKDGKLIISTKKSNFKTSVELDIFPQFDTILKRYKYFAPKISEAVANRAIKTVCQKAGITSIVQEETKKQGRIVTVSKPKYKLIHLHTAKNTFVSNAGERWGLTIEEISAYTGTTVKTLLGHYHKPDAKRASTKIQQAENSKLRVA